MFNQTVKDCMPYMILCRCIRQSSVVNVFHTSVAMVSKKVQRTNWQIKVSAVKNTTEKIGVYRIPKFLIHLYEICSETLKLTW